jgi:hypothetical protein
MKIIITEEQLKSIISEDRRGREPLSQKEVDKRLKKAKDLAVKFPNPRQFALKYPNLWNFLRGKGLIDSAFPNRKIYRPDGYWTPETIAQEASKYNTKSEFYDNNQVAYLKAIQLGIINDLFPYRSDTKVGIKKIWTLEKSIEAAKEFEGGKSEFYRKHPAAYVELKNNDLLSYYFKKKKDVNSEEIINQAKQYKDRVELRKNNLNLYNKLVIRGLLYDVFPKVEMSDDEIINKAKEYQTKSELSKKNRPLYYKLSKVPNGFEIVFGDQHKLTYKAKRFIDIAKQYDNKYELRKNNRYVYNNLEALGLLDKVYDTENSTDELITKIQLTDPVDNKTKKLFKIAGKFKNKYDLKKYNPYVFAKLTKLNLMDKVFPPKPIEKLSLGGTLQDILKSKDDTNQKTPQKISIEPKSPIINKNPKKKLKFGTFGSLENLTKWVAPYKTKKELERKNPAAYICVRENGLFDYFGLK